MSTSVRGSHECVHVSSSSVLNYQARGRGRKGLAERRFRVHGERERERGAKGSFVLPDETSQNDVMG